MYRACGPYAPTANIFRVAAVGVSNLEKNGNDEKLGGKRDWEKEGGRERERERETPNVYAINHTSENY